jgi:hypothetical protein
MTALILAELTDWNHELSRRTLSILTCGATLAGFLSAYHPEIYFWGMLIVFGWLGLSIGERCGGNIHLETRMGDVKLTHWQIIWGEILVAVIIGLIHMVALLPVVILMIYFWGIPGIIIAEAGLIMWMIAVAAASLRILIKRFQWRGCPDSF